MKQYRLWLGMGLSLFLLFGCSIGSTARKPPVHLDAGMKPLVKGIEKYQMGCYHQSLDLFFRAHEQFSLYDQQDGVATTLNNIGNVYRALGDSAGAARFYEEALGTYQDLEDDAGAVQALSNQAAALIDANRYDEAENRLKKAEQYSVDTPALRVSLMKNRGILYLKRKEYPRAEELLIGARKLADPKEASLYAPILSALGRLKLETGDPESAIPLIEEALSADRTAGFHPGIAEDLFLLGTAHFRRENFTLATGYFKRSLKIYALMGDSRDIELVADRLRTASEKAGIDLTVIELFVRQWMDGDVSSTLCR
jgi:tetratricopeptide (TPR) repeat protein